MSLSMASRSYSRCGRGWCNDSAGSKPVNKGQFGSIDTGIW